MTEIVGIRFRGGPKEYYFDPRGLQIELGQYVIVETAQGQEYAQCVTGNHEIEDAEVVQPLRAVLRPATENDKRTWEYNRNREKSAFGIAQKKIAAHGLDMKLVKVESNFDGSKIMFYFTSDGRVDFRALVRDLAAEFRARIELRQIGVRDEAKMLGGIGICGRPFCCAEFLNDFIPVSIKMAKTQSLSLNPTKISGACGRLMCCLKYEQDAYEDAVRRCPKADSFVLTPDGPGNVTNVDILRQQCVVRLDDQPESPRRYRNTELNVLRNGKGSREGIEIPRERPARYVPPEDERSERETAEDERMRALRELLEGPAEEDAAEERRRSRRGGRGRRRGERPERSEAADAAPGQEQTDRPRGDRPPRQNRYGRSNRNADAAQPQRNAQNSDTPGRQSDLPERQSDLPGRQSRQSDLPGRQSRQSDLPERQSRQSDLPGRQSDLPGRQSSSGRRGRRGGRNHRRGGGSGESKPEA